MTTGIVICNLYRRKNKPSVNSEKAEYFISGDKVNIKEVVVGDSFEGVSSWYEVDGGIFVWSGGVSLNLEDPLFLRKLDLDKRTPLPGVLKPFDPKDFWWINDYGIDKIWEKDITGRGVKIAVFDDGLLLPHPDLPLLPNEKFVDITGENSQTEDFDSHGTHVFGILAASNNGFGMKGICFNSDFHFAKITHPHSGYTHRYLIDAINWAIDKKVEIISISHGSVNIDDSERTELTKVLEKAIALNIAVLCAIGNDGLNPIIRYPASLSESIQIYTVGHINAQKNTSEDTVIGERVSIYAPGFKITSTVKENEILYSEKSGSSFSTPYVAGILSLILESKRKSNLIFTALDAMALLLEKSEKKEFGKIINFKNLF